MSKIICEICGTAYPDTESRCPICGWTQDGIDLGIDESDLDFTVEEAPAAPRKTREIFDYDAVNSKEGRKSAALPERDEEEETEEQGANPFLVVLLTILIVALLAATGFVLFKYFLPNMGNKTPETTAPVTTEPATETTEPTIPCTGLSLVSGITELNAEGQNWLLHVVVTPEDTTDVLTYQSLDESIATVNDEGRVTAVSEGQTTVVITCGNERLECPVTVNYQEPTEAPTEAPTQAPAEGETTPAAPTEGNEPSSGTASGVTLKLKKTDITFGIGGVYTTLELDCDLKAEDIEWFTRNSNVAIVRDGVVTAVGPGLTVITAKYGDQTAECIVRCNF